MIAVVTVPAGAGSPASATTGAVISIREVPDESWSMTAPVALSTTGESPGAEMASVTVGDALASGNVAPNSKPVSVGCAVTCTSPPACGAKSARLFGLSKDAGPKPAA